MRRAAGLAGLAGLAGGKLETRQRRSQGLLRHGVGTRYLDFSNDGVRDGDTDCMGCGRLVARRLSSTPT